MGKFFADRPTLRGFAIIATIALGVQTALAIYVHRSFAPDVVQTEKPMDMAIVNAIDKSGVAPLHRAVRNRCAAAAKALLLGGADPRALNRSGSTPMLLATQNTGRGGSGSPEAKAQQKEILRLLKKHGAK